MPCISSSSRSCPSPTILGPAGSDPAAGSSEACDGRFTDHHARLCRMLLGQIDDLSRRIETVTGLLDEAIGSLEARTDEIVTAALDTETGEVLPTAAAYASAVERISQIPGGGPETARAVIGEIGLDMAVFSSAQRLCSWAKCSPRTVQSGRRTKGAPTGKGNPYLKAALGQMATGAAKTDTFLGERYRRLIRRMPKKKALAAIERSILVVIFQLLSDPSATFTELGSDYHAKRIDNRRRTDQLVHQLEALGHRVTLSPAA
ncbi:MAG: transposase [Actinomycetota bacterium]|nr:transposase [Actinomycetota bacterium]